MDDIFTAGAEFIQQYKGPLLLAIAAYWTGRLLAYSYSRTLGKVFKKEQLSDMAMLIIELMQKSKKWELKEHLIDVDSRRYVKILHMKSYDPFTEIWWDYDYIAHIVNNVDVYPFLSWSDSRAINSEAEKLKHQLQLAEGQQIHDKFLEDKKRMTASIAAAVRAIT